MNCENGSRSATGTPKKPLREMPTSTRDRRETGHQLLEARQQLPAVRRVEAEELAPSGVEHELIGVDPGRERHVDPGRQPVADLAHHVAVVGRPVGRVRQRAVLGVHHHQHRAQVADHGRHRRVGAQGRDVVDDGGTQLDAARGGGGMVGVDRQHRRGASARTTGSSRPAPHRW